MNSTHKKSGFIFLEVVIAIALIGMVFLTLLGVGAWVVGLSASIQNTTKIEALSREALESTRSYRDDTTWTSASTPIGLGQVGVGINTSYYLTLTTTLPATNQWTLQSGTETIGNFSRKIVFDKVSRDPTSKIIESVYNASHDDANTRKVTVIVTFKGQDYQTVQYLTNWR